MLAKHLKKEAGMMKFGNKTLHEYDPKNRSESSSNNIPAKGTYISISLTINPEKLWPNDAKMLIYTNERYDKLVLLGLLTKKIVRLLQSGNIKSDHVELVVKIKNKRVGRTIIEKAARIGIVDIYAHHNGSVFCKYD